MTQPLVGNLQLPASVFVGVLVALAYIVCYLRHQQREFSLTDGLMLVAIMAIVTAAVMPILRAADGNAKASVLAQNHKTLQRQIELYKLEHRGKTPIPYKGTFPQLTNATDADGTPGVPGRKHPYGPYFRKGIPGNPYTGSSAVTTVDDLSRTNPTGKWGWFYDEETGRIAPDSLPHSD